MLEASIFELNDGHVKVNRQVEGSVVEAFIPPGTAISYDSLTAILQTRLPVNHACAGHSQLWRLSIAKQNVSFKLPSGETVTAKVKQVTQRSKTKDWAKLDRKIREKLSMAAAEAVNQPAVKKQKKQERQKGPGRKQQREKKRRR